jgi:dihydrofolate reductase
MRRLAMFNNISLDGYFVDAHGEMSWARVDSDDAEFAEFTAGNIRGDGVLVFGRVTYDLMAGFWPTPDAAQHFPEVAERMNKGRKIVFSRTLDKPLWNNTTLLGEAPAAALAKLKREEGPDLVILGSGTIVAQAAGAGLIDEYQFVIIPVILGTGRALFEGIAARPPLKLLRSRVFKNGRAFLAYAPG